jgi:beta-lactamase class A
MALLAPTCGRAATPSVAETSHTFRMQIAAIETRHGGRLGVAVFDSASHVSLSFNADERFPMCSTFKFLAVADILTRVDKGTEHLARRIPYGPGDLLGYAPITRAHVGDGSMPLFDLCAAAIEWSDNTAANLLLEIIGDPAGYTRFARSLGDRVTRLDRNEPTLNTCIPGDQRDTTTPEAMLRDMQAILLGTVLSPRSRLQLEAWMIAGQVGGKRIRAGVPLSWRVGDKTGSGDNGTANTLAIMWPPARSPILAAVYYTGSSAPTDTLNAVNADVGRVIAKMF